MGFLSSKGKRKYKMECLNSSQREKCRNNRVSNCYSFSQKNTDFLGSYNVLVFSLLLRDGKKKKV